MKSLAIIFTFAAFSAIACPDFDSTYICKFPVLGLDPDGESELNVTSSVVDGIGSYRFGNIGVVADGIARNVTSLEEQSKGNHLFIKAFCEKDSVVKTSTTILENEHLANQKVIYSKKGNKLIIKIDFNGNVNYINCRKP